MVLSPGAGPVDEREERNGASFERLVGVDTDAGEEAVR